MKNKTITLVVCLILMIIISLVFDELLYERVIKNRNLKHLGNLSWLLLIFGVGLLGWKKYAVKWIFVLWIYAYTIILGMLFLLGVVDYLIGGFGENIKEAIGYSRFFFTSPMPFTILWMLEVLMKKKTTSSD